MSAKQLMAKAPEMYPQVRSIFEFLADKGKLSEWYKAYTAHFDEDHTGAAAFEMVFKQPIAEVERAWRLWVNAQPAITSSGAFMGIQMADNGSNDGVLITEVVRGTPAGVAKLRPRDVIVSVDSITTTTSFDVRHIIARKQPGETVTLRVRRSGEYLTVPIVLGSMPGDE